MNKKQTAAAINELLETPMTANEIKKMSASKLADKLSALQAADAQSEVGPTMEEAGYKEVLPEAPAEGVTSTMLNGIGDKLETDSAKERKTILRKSAIESPCQFVWQTCEDMKLGQTDGARRKDVLKACTEAGVAFYTARTQIQLWKKAKDAPAEVVEQVKCDANGNPITE